MTEKLNIEHADALAQEIGNARMVQASAKPKAPAKGKRNRTRKAAQQATSGQQANKGQQAKAKATGKGKGKASGQQQAKANSSGQQASGKAEGRTAKGSVPANAISDDAVIRVLVEGNPKKQGTWAERMFAELMQCDGQTVADYADRLANVEGLPKGYRAKPELQLALRREWVRLDPPK